MSIDYGVKKIGFAVGQLITKKATPLKIIYNNKKGVNWIDIDNLISEWEPNVIIIGYRILASNISSSVYNSTLKQHALS